MSRTHRGNPVPLASKDLPLLREGSEDIIQRQITILKHKQLQLRFMGDENCNLQQDVDHLNEVIRGFKTMFADSASTQVIDE